MQSGCGEQVILHLWRTRSRLKGHFVELNHFSAVSRSVNRVVERVRKGRSQWAGTVWTAAEAAGVSGGGLEMHTSCPWAGQPGTVQESEGGRQWAPTSYPPAWACHPWVPGMSMATPCSSESKGSTPRLQNNPETPRSPQKLCIGHGEGAASVILPASRPRTRVS